MLLDKLKREYDMAIIAKNKQYSKLLADTIAHLNNRLIEAAKSGEKELTITVLVELVEDLMKHYNSQGFSTFAYNELVSSLKRLTIIGWAK